MQVETMRKIDYYVGVVLCFLGTILFGWFLKKRDGQYKNVLLIELSEMGSTILADPAMRKLQNELNVNLFFVIFRKNVASLYFLDTVPRENIFTIREDSLWHLVVDTFRFLIWCRDQKIDTTIDLELFARFPALLTACSGAQNRVGFYAFHNEGLYRGEFLTHKVAYNSHLHTSKNFLALVNALLVNELEVPFSKTEIPDSEITLTKVKVESEPQERLVEKIQNVFPSYDLKSQRVVLINPNGSDLLIQRRWMPEYYIQLIQMILENHTDIVVGITGSPQEKEYTENIRKLVDHERCFNLSGELQLTELPTLYSLAELMVSNDSGPAHFASITDLQVYVFFGPGAPSEYKPLGSPVVLYSNLACSPCATAWNHRKTPCTDNVCLQVIKPESVYQVLLPQLETSRRN
ncbi:MAG: glycosyltransferase family 9 protein [SAR324 cluster bacterium]|nr:glycosyltransferase family 9 protein [SAR324 cluster bacterium]